MRLRLDACTFLWLAADDEQLTPRARSMGRSPDNDVFLSALCAWEISIKHRLGRLPLPESPVRYVVSRRVRETLQIEPLRFDESSAVHEGLLPPHHRDPFDRGLIVQAILNGMTLVTPDPVIARYLVPPGDLESRAVDGGAGSLGATDQVDAGDGDRRTGSSK